MSYVSALRCKECGTEYPITPRTLCDDCFGPVEVAYDYDAMRGQVTRQSIEDGPRSLWRYRDLLPIEHEPTVGLMSGYTPLVKADRLAEALGMSELYIKDDSVNYPSLSYKDRVVSVALTKAVEFGFDTIGCASTGNLAHSVSAHGARASLRTFVMIPHDLEEGKIVGSSIFGPRVIKIRGNYDDVNRLCSQIADKYGWAIVNVNLRPFYTEGAKTHGFEIGEQMGWRLPKHTVSPVAGGTILPKIAKSYRELIDLGLVENNKPVLHAAQAEGCSPVVKAIEQGEDWFQPQKPNTLAKSIAIGNPADGHYVIDEVTGSGGFAASADDQQIIDATKLLAKTEGIFTEPAGGATLASAMKLIEAGRIPRHEPTCICITGNGMKSIEVMQGQFEAAPVIDAKLSAFDQMMEAGESAEDAEPAKV